jgi:hypothetical protein
MRYVVIVGMSVATSGKAMLQFSLWLDAFPSTDNCNAITHRIPTQWVYQINQLQNKQSCWHKSISTGRRRWHMKPNTNEIQYIDPPWPIFHTSVPKQIRNFLLKNLEPNGHLEKVTFQWLAVPFLFRKIHFQNLGLKFCNCVLINAFLASTPKPAAWYISHVYSV